MTLKFNNFLKVFEVHVHVKFNQAKCCGLWFFVFKTFCNTRKGERFENLVL